MGFLFNCAVPLVVLLSASCVGSIYLDKIENQGIAEFVQVNIVYDQTNDIHVPVKSPQHEEVAIKLLDDQEFVDLDGGFPGGGGGKKDPGKSGSYPGGGGKSGGGKDGGGKWPGGGGTDANGGKNGGGGGFPGMCNNFDMKFVPNCKKKLIRLLALTYGPQEQPADESDPKKPEPYPEDGDWLPASVSDCSSGTDLLWNPDCKKKKKEQAKCLEGNENCEQKLVRLTYEPSPEEGVDVATTDDPAAPTEAPGSITSPAPEDTNGTTTIPASTTPPPCDKPFEAMWNPKCRPNNTDPTGKPGPAKCDIPMERIWNPACKKVAVHELAYEIVTTPMPQDPTTPAEELADCTDLNDNCPLWAKAGECDKRPEYMMVNCKLSCNNCPPPPPPPTTTTPAPPKTTTKPKCTMPFEEMWNKDCQKNAMLLARMTYDRHSSKKGLHTCADVNVNCLYWAKAGHCEKQPNYMLINCKKSCQNCAAPPPPPTTPTTPAPTTTPKPKAKCDKPYENMWNPDCKKAAMQLSRFAYQVVGDPTGAPEPPTLAPTQPPCTDINANCATWAKAGECDKRPEYMMVNCKKSCNNCPPPPPPPTQSTPVPPPTTTSKAKCTMPFEEMWNKDCQKVMALSSFEISTLSPGDVTTPVPSGNGTTPDDQDQDDQDNDQDNDDDDQDDDSDEEDDQDNDPCNTYSKAFDPRCQNGTSPKPGPPQPGPPKPPAPGIDCKTDWSKSFNPNCKKGSESQVLRKIGFAMMLEQNIQPSILYEYATFCKLVGDKINKNCWETMTKDDQQLRRISKVLTTLSKVLEKTGH